MSSQKKGNKSKQKIETEESESDTESETEEDREDPEEEDEILETETENETETETETNPEQTGDDQSVTESENESTAEKIDSEKKVPEKKTSIFQKSSSSDSESEISSLYEEDKKKKKLVDSVTIEIKEKDIEVKNVNASGSIRLLIEGMINSNCILRIERTLERLGGVISMKMNAIIQQGYFTYNKHITSEEKIIHIIEKLGYNVRVIENNLKRGEYLLRYGNEQEKEIIERFLKRKKIPILSTNVKNKNVKIKTDDPSKVYGKLLKSLKLKTSGLNITFNDNPYRNVKHVISRDTALSNYKTYGLVLLGISIPLMLLVLVFTVLDYFGDPLSFNLPVILIITPKTAILILISFPIHFIFGMMFYKNAIRTVYNSYHFDDNVVVTCVVWILYLTSFFCVFLDSYVYDVQSFHLEATSLLISFLLLEKWLENIVNRQASKWIVRLLEFNLLHGDVNLVKKIRDIKVIKKKYSKRKAIREVKTKKNLIFKGDILKVNKRDVIPTDGICAFGYTTIQNSSLSETKNFELHENEMVLAGCRNISRGIYFQSQSESHNHSVLSKIIYNALSSITLNFNKSNMIMNLVKEYFTHFLVFLSILVFIFWVNISYLFLDVSTIGTNRLLFSLINALNVIVVSSPKSFSSFTPYLTLVVTEILLKQGFVIQKGSLKDLKGITHVVMNKTGVLTKGVFKVDEIIMINKLWRNKERKERTFLKYIACCENYEGRTPVAEAIVKYAENILKQPREKFGVPKFFREVKGKGIECKVKSYRILIGNSLFMKENKIKGVKSFWKHQKPEVDPLKTVVYVSFGRNVEAVIILEDKINTQMKQSLQKLTKKEIKLILMTGDDEKIANFYKEQYGFNESFSNLTPTKKSEKIEELKSDNKKIIFVGDDPIREESCFQKSNISILTNATNEDNENSNFFLVKNDLNGLETAFIFMKLLPILEIIFYVIFIAYHVIFIPVAGGLLFPIFGNVIAIWVCAIFSILFNFFCPVFSYFFALYFKKKLGLFASSKKVSHGKENAFVNNLKF